jgi:hypothetical protein
VKLATGPANETCGWLVPPFNDLIATGTQKSYFGEGFRCVVPSTFSTAYLFAAGAPCVWFWIIGIIGTKEPKASTFEEVLAHESGVACTVTRAVDSFAFVAHRLPQI